MEQITLNGQKRFNEYFAKLILKYCYKDKYSNLQIADKPDLRDIEHNIGIEVVYSMEQDRSEALFLQRQIFCCTDENRKVKLQKNQIQYTKSIKMTTMNMNTMEILQMEQKIHI